MSFSIHGREHPGVRPFLFTAEETSKLREFQDLEVRKPGYCETWVSDGNPLSALARRVMLSRVGEAGFDPERIMEKMEEMDAKGEYETGDWLQMFETHKYFIGKERSEQQHFGWHTDDCNFDGKSQTVIVYLRKDPGIEGGNFLQMCPDATVDEDWEKMADDPSINCVELHPTADCAVGVMLDGRIEHRAEKMTGGTGARHSMVLQFSVPV